MKRSFWALVIAQTQVLVNDNGAKLMLIAVASAVLTPEQSGLVKNILAALMILPAVLFAPLLGWVSDRCSKRNVLVRSLWMQLIVMIIVLAGLKAHYFWIAVIGFFLLGLQCSIFSPAKQGIIKELVGSELLTKAVGWMEMTGIAGILLGSVVGGYLFDYWFNSSRDPWHAGVLVALVLSVFASLSAIICQIIERTPPQITQPFRWSLLWEHFRQMKDAYAQRSVRLCILGNGYFWGLGGAVFLTLVEFATLRIGANNPGIASAIGLSMSLLGVGIVIGAIVVGKISPHGVELGLIPVGAAGLIFGTAGLAWSHQWAPIFGSMLFCLGFFGAFFVVPLNAYLQDSIAPEARGRILSAGNLVLNLSGIAAAGFQALLSHTWHLSPAAQCWVYTIPTIGMAIYISQIMPESLLRFFLGSIARLIYRVRAEDAKHIPSTGGVLLVPNHISYVDAIILQLACPRPIRFLIFDEIYRQPFLNWGLKLLHAIPVSSKRAKTALSMTVEALRAGEVVCIFPEGQLTRTATLQKLNRGFEKIANEAHVPVVPVWMENLWGSVFSFWGGSYFWKRPQRIPFPVTVWFSRPLTPEEASVAAVRQALYDLSEKAFQARPELSSHIGREAVRNLRTRFSKVVITDAFQKGRQLKSGTLLAVAVLLSRWLKKETLKKRIGIVLPPGLGAMIVNLACALADKTPVNLNFTAGRSAVESSLQIAEIDLVLTADAFKAKVKDFPWPEHTVDIASVLKSFSKKEIVIHSILLFLLPDSFWHRNLGLPEKGDHDEAVLLFTSGSSGLPKGVVLSHRNVLANTSQIAAIFARSHLHAILGCLPIFHSFGSTVTLWWPILGGPQVVTYISPLETAKLAEIIAQYQIDLFISTPTFLRSFLKKANREQLKSLKLVVTGAEKLPVELIESFEKTFGIEICEGYGMTEASPVISVNIPNLPATLDGGEPVISRRVGTVGRMIPGISIRIRDIESGQDLSPFDSGMVWFKGANIFEGYLHDPKRTADVLKDGWYCTGDIGHIDEDGFLTIDGRITRFSKIGGEMVPHGTVEQQILEFLGPQPEGFHLVIVGIPDITRGEALVILSTHQLDMAALRSGLAQKGMPNLWIPKTVRVVESIPLLASGKFDLRACQKLAAEELVS